MIAVAGSNDTGEGSAERDVLVAQLKDLGGKAERITEIEKVAFDIVQTVSGGMQGLSVDSSLMEAGVDSLMAVELRNALQSKLGRFRLPTTALIDYPSIAKLARYIEGELFPEGKVPSTHGAGNVSTGEAGGALAVVGISGHFPGCDGTISSFWESLEKMRSGIS